MPTLQDLLQKADCYEAVSHGSAYDFILKLARQQVWGWPVPSLRKNIIIPKPTLAFSLKKRLNNKVILKRIQIYERSKSEDEIL